MILSTGPRRYFVLVVHVDVHGCEQNDAFDNLLIIHADTHDGHAVVHHTHNEGADNRSDDLPNTTGGGSAADETRCDNVEFETRAGLRCSAIQPGGENQTCQRCKDTHVHKGQETDCRNADARQSRCLCIAANRVDTATDRRAIHDERVHANQHSHDDEHGGQATIGRKQVAEEHNQCRKDEILRHEHRKRTALDPMFRRAGSMPKLNREEQRADKRAEDNRGDVKCLKFKQLSAFVVSAGMALSLLSLPMLQAHAAATDADASDSATSKQEMKAQKKADRKARRAKKNAELSKLEKNGYSPAGTQTSYPQNLQNAQQKASGQKPTNSPAVAP